MLTIVKTQTKALKEYLQIIDFGLMNKTLVEILKNEVDEAFGDDDDFGWGGAGKCGNYFRVSKCECSQFVV